MSRIGSLLFAFAPGKSPVNCKIAKWTNEDRDAMDPLLKRRLGTSEVKAAGRRLLRLRDTQRKLGFINYVMKNKVINAEGKIRYMKRRHDYHLGNLEAGIQNELVLGSYCRIMEEEVN